MPSMNDGRSVVTGRESIRMQATGLKTTQPAYNRNLLGALFAVVVLAAVVSALIIVSSGRISGVAPAPNAITQAPAYAHDLPEAVSGAASSGSAYDTSSNRAQFLGQTSDWTPAGQGRVLPIGDERNLSVANSAPSHRTFDRRHMFRK
jgi:hypothetical protein